MAKTTPTPVDTNISFSFGCKVNLGNYESADVHMSMSERWNVEGFDEAAISQLRADRLVVLDAEVMEVVNTKHAELQA